MISEINRLCRISGKLSNGEDGFVDGAVIAAARTLPTWSDGDIPPIPSVERKAVKELQEECHQMLAEYPTTAGQDQEILGITLIVLHLSFSNSHTKIPTLFKHFLSPLWNSKSKNIFMNLVNIYALGDVRNLI